MATVTYLGKKENYGPLDLPWMSEPVKFDKNGFAKGVPNALAVAVERKMPTVFKAGALNPALTPSVLDDEGIDDDLVFADEPDEEEGTGE